MEGVFQKVIRADLTKGLTGEERLPSGWYRKFIGGLGVGIHYLMEDLLPPKPLLDNPFLVMSGPLTGYPISGASKAAVISYSREAGRLKLGAMLGHFPSYLRFAGYDGLIITGRSEEPVTLRLGKRSCLTPHRGDSPRETDESFLEMDSRTEWDSWMDRTPGYGLELSLRNLRRIVVEPDGDLPSAGPSDRWLSWINEDFKTSAGRDEGKRSCFGCTKGCGKYEPSAQAWLLDGQRKKGTGNYPEDRDRSWVDALLEIHGGYEDILFAGSTTIDDLIETENWAMVKNCLPICGRWAVSGQKIALLLNQVTDSEYTEQELSRIGHDLIDLLMGLYRLLNYRPFEANKLEGLLPQVLRSQPLEYLNRRGWGKDGFPVRDSRPGETHEV